MNVRLRLAAAAAAIAASVTLASPVLAQIPAGMDQAQIDAVLGAPISVPPGQTTTVDLGVPVQGGQSGQGWTVNSAGTSVSVTAPDTPGASISVPFSAMGQSRTVTFVTEQGASVAGAAGGAGGGEDPAHAAPVPDEEDRAEGAGTAPVGATPTPSRQVAQSVDTTDTEYIDLEGSIAGNVLTAKLGALQAANLYQKFNSVDQDAVELRYVDVNNQLIEGVKRELDTAKLSMKLTYPEGQTPDNPFFIQVIGPGDRAHAIVRLTAPETELAVPMGDNSAGEEFGDQATGSAGLSPALIVGLVGLAALAVAAAAAVAVSRRKRTRVSDVKYPH